MEQKEPGALSPEIARLLRRIFVSAAIAMVAIGAGAYFTGTWVALAAVFVWGCFLAVSTRRILRLYADEQADSAQGRDSLGPAAVLPEAPLSHHRLAAGLVFLALVAVAVALFAEGYELYAQVPVLLAMLLVGAYIKWTGRRA